MEHIIPLLQVLLILNLLQLQVSPQGSTITGATINFTVTTGNYGGTHTPDQWKLRFCHNRAELLILIFIGNQIQEVVFPLSQILREQMFIMIKLDNLIIQECMFE